MRQRSHPDHGADERRAGGLNVGGPLPADVVDGRGRDADHVVSLASGRYWATQFLAALVTGSGGARMIRIVRSTAR